MKMKMKMKILSSLFLAASTLVATSVQTINLILQENTK